MKLPIHINGVSFEDVEHAIPGSNIGPDKTMKVLERVPGIYKGGICIQKSVIVLLRDGSTPLLIVEKNSQKAKLVNL